MFRSKSSNVKIEEIDTNRDGIIDRQEVRNWLSGNEGLGSTSYETTSTEIYRGESTSGRFGRGSYTAASTYGTVGVDERISSETVIQTNSLEETDRYLERAVDIYKDPTPEIIRRTAMENPVTYEQRVLVRYLQPPRLPPPGPLIVKQIRPPQPPAPPPVVIRQYSTRSTTPPPIILRERPPTPPAQLASETVTRYLPALPVPPRSAIIERYPALPPKPQDIIIERWLPYGPQPERRTIVEEPPSAIAYAEPRNKIIIYEGIEPRVNRKFEKEPVVEGDPASYVARYGSSLLDSETLIRLARKAGVHEDLTPPPYAMSTYTNIHDNVHYSSDSYSRRRGGVLFDFVQYGLFPADYTPGMKLSRKFVRPTNFSFPPSSMWSLKIAKYKENHVDGRTVGVTVELIEDGMTVGSRTISENEYNRAQVYSSAPKLSWSDFLRVLKVFMMGNNQERESDIQTAFDILDQGRRGVFGRTVNLSDGLISPDELRAFLSILTDEYRVDLCVFLADTNGSGQISLSEFTRMVKSGLARDMIF